MNSSFCSEPSEAQVRELAYYLYVASGRVPGHDLENWLRAKDQLSRLYRHRMEAAPTPEPSLHFPLSADTQNLGTPHPFPLRN